MRILPDKRFNYKTLYQHYTSRDTAFTINKLLWFGRAEVIFHNVVEMVAGRAKAPLCCGYGRIKLKDFSEYNTLVIKGVSQ